MENSSPPQPLLLSTAGRMLGENELLDALQRGIRQAFAFLDGGWGTIPPLWWYRFTEIVWYRQRVTFVVDGRAIEATETVVDRPPPICEQRKNLVEKLEQERLTKAIKAALGAATDTADVLRKKPLFIDWAEAEKKAHGSYPPMQPADNIGRDTVRAWASRNEVLRGVAEGWARGLGYARARGRPKQINK